MERLTRTWEEGNVKLQSIIACETKCLNNETSSCRCKPITNVRKRLAEYEDSGLIPAEINDLRARIAELEAELAVTERALELATEEGKPEDCGYCLCCDTCEGENCLQQLRIYFIQQARAELAGEAHES